MKRSKKKIVVKRKPRTRKPTKPKKRARKKKQTKGTGIFGNHFPTNRTVDSNQYWQLRAEMAGAEGRVLANLKDRQADYDRKEANIEKIKAEVKDFTSLSPAQQAFAKALRTPPVANAGPGARTPSRRQPVTPGAPSRPFGLDSTYDSPELSVVTRDVSSSLRRTRSYEGLAGHISFDSQVGSRGEKSWRRAEKFPSGTTKAERSFSRSMQQSNALSPSSPRSRAKSPARHFDKLRQDVSDRERAAAPGEKRKNPLVVNPAYDPSFSLSYDPKSDSAFIPDDKAED